MARRTNGEKWTAAEIRMMDHHTTWHDFATAQGAARAVGIELHTVWHGVTRSDYDVSAEKSIRTSRSLHPRGGIGLVAIYTVDGKGWVELRGRDAIEIPPRSVLIFGWEDLHRYHSLGGKWEHWWFEFETAETLPCPVGRRMDLPTHVENQQEFQDIFAALHRDRPEQRSLASAIFCKILHRWIAEWEGEEGWKLHQQAVERVIDLMHENLHKGWTVREMASAAHMAERTFRGAFHGITGKSPKEFYDNLRLTKARDLLRLEGYTVAEVAYRLGFSSPFHLSNAFSRHFGVPPSRIGAS
jgi:AraC-like DNA-binding protein